MVRCIFNQKGKIMSETTTVTDALGRSITLKPMNVRETARLIKIIGREDPRDAQNQTYVTMALIAASVTAIDDVPTQPIIKPEHIEDAIARLGDEGFAAVQVQQESRRLDLEAEATKAAAKN